MYFEGVLPYLDEDIDAILTTTTNVYKEWNTNISNQMIDYDTVGNPTVDMTGEMWTARNKVLPREVPMGYGAVRVGTLSPDQNYEFKLSFVKNQVPVKINNFTLTFFDVDNTDGELKVEKASKVWTFDGDGFNGSTVDKPSLTVVGKEGLNVTLPEQISDHLTFSNEQKMATFGFRFFDTSEVKFAWRPKGYARLLVFNGHSLKQCPSLCKEGQQVPIKDFLPQCPLPAARYRTWYPSKIDAHIKEYNCKCNQEDCCRTLHGTDTGRKGGHTALLEE